MVSYLLLFSASACATTGAAPKNWDGSHALLADTSINDLNCSLRCNQAQGGVAAGTLDPTRVARLNRGLERQARDRSIGRWTMQATGVLLDSTIGALPIIGPSITRSVSFLEGEMVNQANTNMRRLVDAQVRDLMYSGRSGPEVRGDASQIISSLIGPQSQFPSLFKESTAYDSLQDAALQYLATRVDELTRQGNIQAGNLNQVRGEVASNLQQLQQLRARLEEVEQQRSSITATNSAPAPGPDQPILVRETSLRIRAAQVATYGAEASRQLGAAADIIQQLGGDSRGVRTAANVIGVAAGLAASYANPLYLLPTLASAGSLFGGGGGPDPYLKAILAQIQQLRKEIAEFREEVREQHQLEMETLGAIQSGLIGLLAEIQTNQDQGLGSCWNLLPNPYDITVLGEPTDLPRDYAWSPAGATTRVQPALLNARELRPASYADIQAFYGRRSSQIDSCLLVLGQLYSGGPQLGSRLRLSTVIELAAEGSPNAHRVQLGQPLYQSYRHALALQSHMRQIEPLLRNGRAAETELGRQNLLAWGLSAPSPTVVSLHRKLANLSSIASDLVNTYPQARTAQGGMRLNEFREWVTSQPVDAEYVATTSSLVLLAAWWHEFASDRGLRDLNQITIGDAGETVSRLHRALHAVRIALAQQAALEGDLLLEVFGAWLDRKSTPPPFVDPPSADWWHQEAPRLFTQIVRQNPLLAHNLGLYWVSGRIGDGSTWPYEVAWNVQHSSVLLEQVLGNLPGRLVWRENRWWLVLPNASPEVGIPLPTPVELRKGEFAQSLTTQTLVILEAQLSRELALYEVPPTPEGTELRNAARAGLLRL
ncbi:MAG: hypothetical protein ACK4SZ_06680 [Allosphingosinicella sp.]|uniref:hypothetical protein n=1 Tax=Allosphingosinicella sp. TaxID=2823234 RepID=UPI003957C865